MRVCAALSIALALSLIGAGAQARVRVCIQVNSGQSDSTELRRLVKTELDRHPSHQAVEDACESHLRIELVQIDARERYVTGRIDTQVPHRESVGSDGMAAAVERLLTIVLHNAPQRLRGPERDDWIGRTKEAFLLRGTTHFGLELYQTTAWVDDRLQALPGAAFAARRELDRVHVGVRLGAASVLGDVGPGLHLAQQVLAQVELGLFSSGEADIAGFAALTAGLEYQRFAGPSSHPERRISSASFMGFSGGARGGVELLRTSHARAQLFVQLLAPAFVARDDAGTLIDQWTPTAAIGLAAWL
jgi:hypothetical protein